MKSLLVLAVSIAIAHAAPSGIGGVVVSGPSGVVTGHGAIGPVGHGWGHAGAVIAGPGLGLGWGHGWGHGLGAITNGGGTIGVSGHGATIAGPGTAPVVVAGPSGKVAADGLWGPTGHVGHVGWHGLHG